ALNAVLHRYFEVWVVLLAYVLGGIALIVPPLGIWLLFRWSMSLPALFEEDGGGIAALGRSWALVRKRWWRTLGVLLVAGILAALVGAAIAGVLGALAGALPGTALEIRLGALARAIASAVVGPFPALVAVLLYLDLRTRSAGVPPSAPN
ncbi:MAG: hypothetical protein ACREPA_11420, partial [Candidatus Dormibacteraceae bacterium]